MLASLVLAPANAALLKSSQPLRELAAMGCTLAVALAAGYTAGGWAPGPAWTAARAPVDCTPAKVPHAWPPSHVADARASLSAQRSQGPPQRTATRPTSTEPT